MTVNPTRRRKPPARAPKIACARCDTRLADPSKRIYSTHTRLHYCADITACSRRAARKARSSRTAVAA